mmetsp:Transcript_15822/g.22314  ORF Transcript_15822/g.22314 Transcript_15822/m.22314 type:complete len:240 (-) Transcript_15822:107-826(-)
MLITRLYLAFVATAALVSVATASRTNVEDDLDVESPFTCSVSAFDEDACKATKDDDGKDCVWCSFQFHGFCVSGDQSEIIEQAVPQVTCDSYEEEEVEIEGEDDTDSTSSDLFDCLSTADKNSCNGGDDDACTWCDTSAGFGLCLSTDAASVVGGYSWFTCDDTTEETGDPFDPSCIVAGLNSDDAETVCKGTSDQDGDSCVWCDVGGIYGLCLNPDQADEVSQFTTCGSADLIDAEVA